MIVVLHKGEIPKHQKHDISDQGYEKYMNIVHMGFTNNPLKTEQSYEGFVAF